METDECEHCIRPPLCQSCAPASPQCIANQRNSGCHACDVLGCWRTNPQCAYWRKGHRERPLVLDARTDGHAAPNMFRRRAVRICTTPHGVNVMVDGRKFFRGFASGESCNCLIHTLQQCINDHIRVIADHNRIREELMRRFPPSRDNWVGPDTYLDFRPHWQTVVELIGISGREHGFDEEQRIRPETFSVICIQQEQKIVGDEDGVGPVRLYIMNQGFRHFVPLLRMRNN